MNIKYEGLFGISTDKETIFAKLSNGYGVIIPRYNPKNCCVKAHWYRAMYMDGGSYTSKNIPRKYYDVAEKIVNEFLKTDKFKNQLKVEDSIVEEMGLRAEDAKYFKAD